MSLLNQQRTDYRILRIISKNSILAGANEDVRLLYGKGLGDEVFIGQSFDKNSRIQEEYHIDGIEFGRILDKTDMNIVAICEDAIHLICEELAQPLDPQIHITLTDHISLLVNRIRRNEKISNPILIQTEILYREEYRVAKQVVDFLERSLGLLIPEGETGFIALYIHGARSDNHEELPNTMRYPLLANAVTEYLESVFEREVEKDTLDYVRLVTHLRFAIERVTTGNAIKNLLLQQIQEEYGEAYDIALNAAHILEKELDCNFPEDEVAFFALYVERLRQPDA